MKLKTHILDLGNSNIKLEDETSFISSFKEYDKSDESEQNILEYNDKKYAMEKLSDFDGEFNKTKKDYIPNLLWGLDKLGIQDGESIRLVLMLPVGNLGQADKFKDNLVDKPFKFKTDSEKTIVIKEVVIIGEGIASYYSLDKNLREEDLVIIDLGGRTTNVVEYSNKKIVNKDTINIGMIDFYDQIKVEYNNLEGQNVETFEVQHYINKNVIPSYSYVEEKFVAQLINKINVKFNLGLGKKVIFTGGGAITLKNSIQKYNSDYMFVIDGLFSNIKGCCKLARAKGWI